MVSQNQTVIEYDRRGDKSDNQNIHLSYHNSIRPEIRSKDLERK